jgi:hypothetical protein
VPGLHCWNEANDSTFEGTCVILASLGATCGGATPPGQAPVVCEAGLSCDNDANDPAFPGECVAN